MLDLKSLIKRCQSNRTPNASAFSHRRGGLQVDSRCADVLLTVPEESQSRRLSRAGGIAPCTPAFLDQDRSSALLGRGASALRNLVCLNPSFRSALLVRLRRQGDSGWATQGNAEAVDVVAAVRRLAPAADRRTTKRGRFVPTAATVHAEHAQIAQI